jgi:hypothetical protein
MKWHINDVAKWYRLLLLLSRLLSGGNYHLKESVYTLIKVALIFF